MPEDSIDKWRRNILVGTGIVGGPQGLRRKAGEARA